MNQLIPTTGGLTAGQQEAAEKFFNFLMGPDQFFTISGGPGVGKTFLTAHLSNEVMKRYELSCQLIDIKPEYDTVSFTATTNKAAEVLEKGLGKPVTTIHSFLGLKVTENYATGKTSLSKTNNYRIRSRQIVFIDEASMVDTPLFNIILESFTNSKIIFVGDHAQMSPVGEPKSPVFAHTGSDNFVFLSQPVRNSGSPALMDLCNQLRNTVETGVFKPIKEVPGSIEYLDDDEMQNKLTSIFSNPDPSSRVLCYTNTRVESFNDFIRTDVRNQPEEFQVGDTLVVAQNYIGRSSKGGAPVTLNVEREVIMRSIGDIQEEHTYAYGTRGRPILYRICTVSSTFGGLEVIVKLPVNKQIVQNAIRVYAADKKWPDYFALRDHFIDLRDKSACTVYKSQGSTYETVFMDIGNIGTSYDAAQVARMLLVGASRATTKVYLYGRLPAMYHGKD